MSEEVKTEREVLSFEGAVSLLQHMRKTGGSCSGELLDDIVEALKRGRLAPPGAYPVFESPVFVPNTMVVNGSGGPIDWDGPSWLISPE